MDTTTNNNDNKIPQQFSSCVSTVGLSNNERIKAQQKRQAADANRYAACKFMLTMGCSQEHINNALKDY